MNLALSILFLWLGAALLYVAFHQLSLETAKGAPEDVIKSLQSKIAAQDSAYNITGTTP